MKPKAKLNTDLLTPEELAMPMGLGYVAAADRLGLIYLADTVAMAVLLSQFGTQAMRLSADYAAALLNKPQCSKAEDELIDRLAEILRGENPRYMAIPWFTDPDQLARSILDDLLPDYAAQSEFLARLKADPIREQTLNFLTTITDPGVIETESEMSDLIVTNTSVMLGIPLEVPLPLDVHVRPGKSIVVVRKASEAVEAGIDAVDDSPMPGSADQEDGRHEQR